MAERWIGETNDLVQVQHRKVLVDDRGAFHQDWRFQHFRFVKDDPRASASL